MADSDRSGSKGVGADTKKNGAKSSGGKGGGKSSSDGSREGLGRSKEASQQRRQDEK